MIIILNIFISMTITLLFIMIANYYSKTNKEKSIHITRVALSLKFLIYIPSAFIMSYFLSRFQYKSFFPILPILFIILLMFLDSISFYKIIKKVRGVDITFFEYIIDIFKECIVIIIPLCVLFIIKNILANTDNFVYTISIVLALCIYNLLYPYLMKLRFRNCHVDNLLLKKLGSNFNYNISTYRYNGKKTKDCNALVCGFLYSFNIYVSDFLIENTSEDELFSILLHEIGHIKKHHTLIKNTFLITSIPLMIALGALMDEWELYFGEINKILGLIFFLTAFIMYSIILFLYISRRQEFEADKFAIENGADINAFAEALNKLRILNSFVENPSFIEQILSTHPSTPKRISKIKSYNN